MTCFLQRELNYFLKVKAEMFMSRESIVIRWYRTQNENINLVYHLIVWLNLRPILKGRQTQKTLNVSSFFSPGHISVKAAGAM